MAEVLLLHVGAPKTGTTYLQTVIWENRDVLAAQGIDLPLGRRRQLAASANLRNSAWSQEMPHTTWERLVDVINDTPGTCLVSEELLSATSRPRVGHFVRALAPGTRLKVIFTARDPGRQVPAMWQHAIRGRQAITIEEFLEELRADDDAPYWRDQNPLLAHHNWGAWARAGDFHLVTVPPSGADPALLWKRFAGVLGVDADSVVLPSGLENESLGMVETELLRRVNARLGDRFPMRRKYLDAVRRNVIMPGLVTSPDRHPIVVPDEFADWLQGRAQSIVDELRGLGEAITIAGDLDELVQPIRRTGPTTPDLRDEAMLLDALLDAWIRQLEVLEVRQAEVLEMRRALRQAQAQLDAGGIGRRALRRARRTFQRRDAG